VKRPIMGMLALAISGALMAAPPSAPRFDTQRISADVKTLSSDAYEGRAPATPGEDKTVAYLSAQFQAAGLQPGGDLKDGKRLWTQAVPLRRADIVGSPQIAIERDGQRQALTQGQQIALRAALDGSSQVAIDGAPLVFVGYGVKAPERGWDDFKGVDLKGKIAVVLINDPDFETGKGAFDGKGMTYYGRWTYKYEEGARQGAAGVLIVHETAPASYGWATVASSNTNSMFDVVRDDPKSAHPALEGWIQRDLAVDLFKRAGLDFETLKKQAQSREFKPVELKGERLHADYAVKSEVITSHNVVARLPGSTHPDDSMIYTAHWDHIGVGAPDANGDRIFNGALDNASGTAALLELARVFAQGPGAAALGGVPGGHRRGEGPARLGVLRLQAAVSAGAHGGGDQHGRHEPVRSVARFRHLRHRQARPAGGPEDRRQALGPALHAGSQAGSRLLLPLRPFLLRQARRAGAVLRRRAGLGGRRDQGRQGRIRRLHRQALPPARRRMAAELDLRRCRARPAGAVHAGIGAGRFDAVAELERGLGVPRHPRRQRGAAAMSRH